ncbi:MAG: hypothetical protein ABFD29_02290 [Anaerolineaceae bacterium]
MVRDTAGRVLLQKRADGQESSEVRFFELDHLPPLDEKNLRWIKEAWNSEAGAIFR